MCAIGVLISKTLTERRLHSNEAKTRNPLKFAGVPQTTGSQSLVGWSSPYSGTCGADTAHDCLIVSCHQIDRYWQINWREQSMGHPAFTPDSRASPHFGPYSFLVPRRVGGWVGLGDWLHTEVVCPPKTVTHPGTSWARRRVTSLIRPTSLRRHARRKVTGLNVWHDDVNYVFDSFATLVNSNAHEVGRTTLTHYVHQDPCSLYLK